MLRRDFLQRLALGISFTAAGIEPAPAAARRGLLIQQSPLAGFQHHAGPRLWAAFKTGDTLQLLREPDNLHDPRAVAVHWGQFRIGYLPRKENFTVAQMMDRSEPVIARIETLADDADPWKRMRLAVTTEI